MSTAAVLAACAGTPRSEAPASSTAVADRASVIAAVRAIDTCALYGDATAVTGLPLTVVGTASPLSCDARVGTADQKIEADVSLNVAPQPVAPEQSWVKHTTIDGVDVGYASSADAPNSPPLDQLVIASCNYSARYPGDVKLTAYVSAPPKEETCAIAEELLRTAMRRYAERPQWDSSDRPRTVLTGADACGAVERLRPAHRVDVDIANSTVNSCYFRIDGGPDVDLSFGYQKPALLAGSTEEFTLSGDRVAGEPDRGVYDVLVGEQFTVGGETLQPVVSIVDLSKDRQRIRLIAQAVADEY